MQYTSICVYVCVISESSRHFKDTIHSTAELSILAFFNRSQMFSEIVKRNLFFFSTSIVCQHDNRVFIVVLEMVHSL